MKEFVLKKKEIGSFCTALSGIAGPFAVYSPEGRPLYESPNYTENSSYQRMDIDIDGSTAAAVSGDPAAIEATVSLIRDYISLLRERKELTSHTLSKYRELSFISAINEILNTSINIDETLAMVTGLCRDKAGVENCSIMTLRGGILRIKAASGRVVNEDSWLDPETGIAGKVFRTGKPVIVNTPEKDGSFRTDGPITIRNILCVPLMLKENVTGLINMSNKAAGNFTSEDMSLILSISSMIAGAIETSNLLEEKIRDERFSTIGQMAAGIIHDIKNPMATIKGFAGLLGDLDFSPDERKQYSEMIVSEVDRLVLMIEDLLAFSRGFKSKYNIESVLVGEYLRESLPLMEKSLKEKGVHVELRLDYDGPVMIDREKFRRVIFNLTGNAAEAMNDERRLLILFRRSGETAELVISDTGPGIPAEIMDSLFEPFVTMGKKKGTGLGLAITKRIIDDLNGSIRVENGNYSGITGYDGANFIILLPVEKKGERHGPSQ